MRLVAQEFMSALPTKLCIVVKFRALGSQHSTTRHLYQARESPIIITPPMDGGFRFQWRARGQHGQRSVSGASTASVLAMRGARLLVDVIDVRVSPWMHVSQIVFKPLFHNSCSSTFGIACFLIQQNAPKFLFPALQ
mmetsp:Transcript_58595/g.113069  ORF Transcript_58595/g.113069 Transcript_58595/m.113069 type:complete len:137 (-) Transcript_58595:177-587(-)